MVGCKKKPTEIQQLFPNHLYTASKHQWAQTDTTSAAAVIQDSALADPDTFFVGFFSDTIYARGVPVFLRTTYTDHKVYTGEISY
ncbi:MAG: hypothetical protein JST76_14930, partial [Bacteroidetes bacterium]|nr:hypothetical protein [Bacteroidota bacterium]